MSVDLVPLTAEQQRKRERGVALFDFDGTLLPWDAQLLFANHVLRAEPWRRFYLIPFLALSPAARILGAGGMKRVFLSYLWQSTPGQIEQWAREWVAREIPRLCFPAVLERLRWHQQAGHLTILSSASPEFYVREIGRVLGFDLALGTPVALPPRMPVFPDLENHKGVEKVWRLEPLLGAVSERAWPGSHGYTDSCADLPLMRACVRGTVVNPSPGLEKMAMQCNWDILRPDVPWTSARDKARKMLRLLIGGSLSSP